MKTTDSDSKHKWPKERSAQLTRYESALALCSRTLLHDPPNEDEERHQLDQALAELLQATEASRAYIYRNLHHPEYGFCMGMIAEVCAPGVHPQIHSPENSRFPWARVPNEMRQTLKSGRSFGGPVEVAFRQNPELVEMLRNQRSPLRSTVQFPIHLDRNWWGFIGFDDVENAREWDASEISLLQTASEMISSTLHRRQIRREMNAQYLYQQALANCSQVLLQNPDQEEEQRQLLNEAMAFLGRAVAAARVYIIRNYHHPELGYCMRILAEVCATGVESHIQNERNQRFPWSRMPKEFVRTLREGQPYGGHVEEAFASTPHLVEGFLNQAQPLRSVLTFPLHFGAEWWGLIGFDNVNTRRNWTDNEVLLLRTASEMISSALQRWEGHFALEERVAERTSELRESNRRLRREIEQRKQAEVDLAHRLDIERILTTVSRRLLEHGNPGEAMLATLEDLGQLANAQRALLMFLDSRENPFDAPVLQWHRPGKEPLPIEGLLQIGADSPWLMEKMLLGESVIWNSPEDLLSHSTEGRELFAEYGVTATAIFPMIFEGALIAVLVYTGHDYQDDQRAEILRILQHGANLIESMVRREMILATLERRVVEGTRELATIFDITMLDGRAKSLSELLELTIHRLAEASDLQAICIHVLTAERDAVEVAAQVGLPENASEKLARIPLSPAMEDLLQYTEGKALVGNLEELAVPLPAPLKINGFETYFGAQLRARGEMVGIFSAYRSAKQPFRLNEVSLLVVLAEQLGVLIENHRLQQQAEAMAVIGERQRLARELHDSITQSLYSQTLFARSGRYALEDNDHAKLHDSLRNLEMGAMNALREMRLLLHQLKPFALETQGLHEAIEQRFDDVERRLGIRAACQMPEQFEFDSETISQLYRITMEALNNSLKHAQATEVRVQLQSELELATLKIIDNGIGFDPHNTTPGMGLAYMRGRVDHLQGVISIASSPDGGTKVTVEFPVETP